MPGLTKTILLIAALIAGYMAVSVMTHSIDRRPVCEVPVVVEVLNGCGEAGIAEKAATHLRRRGFDVMYVGNAEDFEFPETMVVDRGGDRDKAIAVGAALGDAQVIRQVRSAFFVDVTVIIGEDALSSSWFLSDSSNRL